MKSEDEKRHGPNTAAKSVVTYSNSYILLNFNTNECFTFTELPRSNCRDTILSMGPLQLTLGLLEKKWCESTSPSRVEQKTGVLALDIHTL